MPALHPLMSYAINQALLFGAVLMTMFLGGLVVRHWDVRVHYVRKICTFLFLFYALTLDHFYPPKLPYLNFLSTLGWVACFSLLSLRTRVTFLAVCFSAVDRPEDRPHTNRWIIAEFVGNFVVMQCCIAAYAYQHLPNLIWLSFLTVTFGDGFAEPVGFRFGRHTYTARALYGGSRHVRSLEGSACVFLVTALILVLYHSAFTQRQLIAALAVVPWIATLAEAFSPHTCDGPMMHAGMTASLIIILLFC